MSLEIWEKLSASHQSLHSMKRGGVRRIAHPAQRFSHDSYSTPSLMYSEPAVVAIATPSEVTTYTYRLTSQKGTMY